MPIKENFTTTKLYTTLNRSLVLGTVTSGAFNFNNGFGLQVGVGGPSSITTGADDGITFGFNVIDASGVTTFGILQSTTETGSYTSIPVENLLQQTPLSTPFPSPGTGTNVIRAGVIGNTGPYYKVTATSGVSQGIVWAFVEITTFELPIRLTSPPAS